MRYFILYLSLMMFNSIQGQEEPVRFVNPFIGTQRMGHTFPGATVPFGMVQLRKANRSIMPGSLQEVF